MNFVLDGFFFLLKKGEHLFALGEKLFQEDDRIKVEQIGNGVELTIRQAVEEDGGEYSCQTSSKNNIELVHEVQIRGD